MAELVAGARVVKAANTLPAELLGADPRDAGGRRVLFLSGDNAAAKAEVGELFEAAGLFPIDLGDPCDRGTPAAGHGRPACSPQPGAPALTAHGKGGAVSDLLAVAPDSLVQVEVRPDAPTTPAR